MKVGRHKILQVNGNKPNSITSLVSFKHNVLCKAVACLLICVFTITNITYGHDRSDLDTLKRVRNRESAASETVVNHEFVASSPVVQKPARTATTVTEPAREEVVMSYDVAWVLGNMARLENSYARAVRKEAQKILQHGLWHRRRVERSYRVVRKRVELYLKMLSRWSVAHEVLDDYSRRLDLIHRDIMDIFTVLEDLSWPVEYSRKSTPSGDVITIAPVSPRMAEKAERRAGSVWERWQAQREGGIKWASRFVAAKERIEEQKRSVDEVSGEAAKLMPELNSLNAFKSDLKAAFMKELATLTIDAEGSFERCLTARVFLDGGDQQAKAFRRVIGSYFPTTSERLIEGSAQDVFETMTENRKSEEERRVKHDYDIAIELPHSLGNITTALRFDETAQDLLSKSVGRDFMILRIGSGAIAAVKILAGASIIWAVLMILMPKAGTEPATPKAPRAPPALTAIEIAKLVEDTQTPPPSKEDLLVSQHALLNEIIDTVNAMGVDSEEAKKRRAAVIENINKRKEALEDEKNKIAESQTQLDEKMAPPQELTAQLADIRSEASGLEDITLTEEERRTPPVPQEWSPMQERPAPALPERTDDGFSGFPGLEGGLFGRGDARLAINDIGPDKVTHGGGNTEMGPWIASVKGNIRYLGKAGYSRINPVTGEYSPVEPKWQSWKLDSARTPSGWVAMAAYNARETVILMPPGHVVVDIHTENPGVKGSVYYDTANRVWVVKFDREPGNLFRVGVAPAKPGELKKIGVIEIDEKAGDTWRDSLPDAVQRILDLAKKLPLEQRKEVKNGIMKRLYYTTNPLIDELMGEEDNFIRITFKLFAVKCDGAILADASLSHELDAAMAIEVGLMDADGNATYHQGEMHARGETPDGIEEATALLGATSPLFGKRATDREWRKELEHIRKRAERALQELEILYEKLRLGEKEKELEEEIARAEAEMAEVAVTTLESSRGSYERLLGEYDRKLNAIPVLSDVDVDLNNCLPDIESLLEVCRQFEFTAQNAGNDLQLMALGHFLFRILERIEDRNNQRAFYVGDTVAFARLERDILDARAQLFEKIEDFAAENGRKLSEPFPKHVYPPGMNYRPSSGKKPEEDIIIIEVPVGEWVESYTFDTQGNLVISVGVVPLSRNDIVYETTYKNGMKIVRGYKKERFVIDTVTGERIEIPSHVPVNVVDYSNGIAVINYAGDCYELRGEGTDEYRTIIYSGFKGLYTALNGEWLACVERDDEGWKFIGPLAEKTELMLNIITNIRYVREESIRVLPNGKWIAVVEYEDGTQGYVGTLALRGRRLLHGQSYAVRVDDPVVFSDGTWLGSWYNRETESTELCGTHAEQFRNDITEALPEGVDTATMTSVVLTDYAFTPDGDWLAVVAFGDGTQGFIGPIATKLNLTERIPPTEAMGNEYRTVRRIDEVHPEGLVVLTCYEVSESPTANTWPVNAVQICVGPVAKTAHLDKIKEILHVELLPDDTCFAVIDKGDSWAFLKVLGSGLNSAGMTKRDDSTMGGFIILPDGSWIASYSIGGTEGETRADGSTMLNWGVIQRYTTEGTLITTESPGTLWKVTGPIAVRARSSRQVFLDKPIMAPNGSFCGLVRDGDNYAFKGPLADKGGLASEKFPYWPDKAAVISDGRWLVTSPVEGGGFRLTGPLSSIGDVGKITWDTLPYEIAVKETPFGVALYVNDICYFEPKEGAGVNYLERLEALYNTGSFRVYPHIGEGRPDLLWQACEALTKRRMTRAWTSLHRVLDNVGLDPYSVDQPSPRHNFDLEKALKVIRENIWILQQYNEEELYRFLEAVSAGHIIIECLYDLEEGRSSDQRMKQIIETCGFTEAQWNRIISD